VFAVACSLVIMLFIRSLENPETKVQ
jgi:hypothetical protein